jgi:exopolysaccharide biosynthesis WecB/TagA/CpsF family protein
MPAHWSNSRAPLALAGVHVPRYGWDESLSTVVSTARERPARVYWVYANCVNIAHTDPAYRAALDAAEFVLNDGAGIEFAGRMLGTPMLANLCGTDWIPALLTKLAAAADPECRRVYLLGARPQVVAAARSEFKKRWPQLTVVGISDGYSRDAADVLAEIRATRPHILLVAMGVPRQELWIHDHWNELTTAGLRLAVAGGAILDFLTGAVPRAPLWIRRLRLEWLFRLIREPRRLWRRYLLGNVTFLLHVIREIRSRRRRAHRP